MQDSLLDLMSGLCGYAIDNDLLRVNPAKMLPKSQRPRVRSLREVYTPNEAEIDSLLTAITDGWRTYFLLLAETGLRTSEALGLTWADVDFQTNTIRVEHQLAKGSASTRVALKTRRSRRSVHLTTKLRRELLTAKLKTKHKADTDLVFATKTGQSVGSYNARRAFLNALTRAKIETHGRRLSPHSLRHAYGTRLLVAGLPVEAVSRLLGHASPVVTLTTYSHTLEHLVS